MLAAIRSEVRKLLTVRSTYFIILASLAITAFFAGFIEGIRADVTSLHNTSLLAHESTSAIMFVGLILAFAGLLMAGHEYRYNTIMYTLASTNRRYKVLASKLIVITVFAVLTSLLITFFSPLCTLIGLHFSTPVRHGLNLVPQNFDYWQVIWHCVFCGWGYAMYAFFLLIILRSQIGAIVTFLLVPLIAENILAPLLKSNVIYLPFTAVQSVAAPTSLGNHTTSAHEAVVVLVYLAIALLISAGLFIRRDAN